MHTAVALVGAAFLAAAAMMPARAEVVTLMRNQAWEAYGGASENGVPVCGIVTTDRDPQGILREFHVKWFHNNGYLSVQVMKATWSIPAGTPVPFEYRIDGGQPFRGTAHGETSLLEWRIPMSEMRDWFRQFMQGLSLRLAFGDGDEPAMTLSLRGSSAAMAALADCILRLRTPRGGGNAR